MIHKETIKFQLDVEQKDELRQHMSSRYVIPVWSSSSATIKRLVRFVKLTIVEMCWLSNISLRRGNSPGNMCLLFGCNNRTLSNKV